MLKFAGEKMTQEEEYKKLRTALKYAKKTNANIQKKMDALREQIVDAWAIERKMSAISHKYQKGDIVAMKTGEMAEVKNLIGIKNYKVFIQSQVLKSGLGIMQKVHEKEILCHAFDLVIAKEHIKYKEHGIRD